MRITPIAPEDNHVLATRSAERPAILVENKADLARSQAVAHRFSTLARRFEPQPSRARAFRASGAEIFSRVGGEPGFPPRRASSPTCATKNW